MAEDTPSRPSTSESPLARAKGPMKAIFADANLADFLRKGPALRVGLLAAGVPVEAWALRDYLQEKGITTKEPFTAYDISSTGKELTQRYAMRDPIELDYQIGDLSDSELLGDREYDLLVLRKPDAFRNAPMWRQVIDNAVNHLSDHGILVVTTDLPEVKKLMIESLTSQHMSVQERDILQERQLPPHLTENTLIIAQKSVKQ